MRVMDKYSHRSYLLCHARTGYRISVDTVCGAISSIPYRSILPRFVSHVHIHSIQLLEWHTLQKVLDLDWLDVGISVIVIFRPHQGFAAERKVMIPAARWDASQSF